MKVRLFSWHRDQVEDHARALRKSGLDVEASPLVTGRFFADIRDTAPDVVLIDLDRVPSHGLNVAILLRTRKSTRAMPLVFAGGADEKVEKIRAELPDAVYTDWAHAAKAVRKALKTAPKNPILPAPHMTRYSGTPLEQKLGIKPDLKITVIAAPEEFRFTGDSAIRNDTRLIFWFVRSAHELAAAVDHASARMPEGASIWIAYPKKAGRYKVDFSQNDVRAAGVEAGLVDYKICAIDADWTGLKFARRKK